MASSRRAQGCWTCKQRKIGCDRGSPACNNCLRTGRECLGYNIRLAWPDQPDGRRRVSQLPGQATQLPPVNARDYGKQFLNVTYSDLLKSRNGYADRALALALAHEPPAPRLKRIVPFVPDLREREAHLLEYYQNRLSKMISTVDINNGFREELLPMALTSSTSAANGLRNSMLALAALHQWGAREALPYKAKALGSLSSSLSTESVGITQTQLATSMMLCVYNVFDETEGNWNVHLNGAKDILRELASLQGGFSKYRFLYTWFLYHEILGCFSNPERHGLYGPASFQLAPHVDPDSSLIIGSLGCSVEVMEVISYVNGLRAAELRGDARHYSTEERVRQNEEWQRVESRLTNLEQRLDPSSLGQLTQQERTRILTTAEMYRVATMLYLQRTGGGTQANEIRAIYLDQAFRLLKMLAICTSPWPLFVIACESETDEQRIKILQTLDRMDNERHIGNYFVLREIIEMYWKQQDLHADNPRNAHLKWWDIIDLNTTAPWFI